MVEVSKCENPECAGFRKIARVRCPICGKDKVLLEYRGDDASIAALSKDHVFWGCIHGGKVHITPILRSLCE